MVALLYRCLTFFKSILKKRYWFPCHRAVRHGKLSENTWAEALENRKVVSSSLTATWSVQFAMAHSSPPTPSPAGFLWGFNLTLYRQMNAFLSLRFCVWYILNVYFFVCVCIYMCMYGCKCKYSWNINMECTVLAKHCKIGCVWVVLLVKTESIHEKSSVSAEGPWATGGAAFLLWKCRAVYSITHFLIRKSVLAPAVMHQGRNAFVPGCFVGIA